MADHRKGGKQLFNHTVWLAVCVLTVGVTIRTAYAITWQQKREVLKEIGDFADRLCDHIPIEGSGQNVELSGNARAELSKLASKLADLGIEGAGKYQKSQYEGLLQKDLATELENSRDCKREIFRELKQEFFKEEGGSESSAQPTQQPAVKQPSTPMASSPQKPSSSAPTPEAGNVIYEADWSEGLNGWLAVPGWRHVSNMLVSDGSPGHPARIWIPAPYQPDTTDYAVEAEIQLLNPRCGATYKEFGLVARAVKEEGIIGGYKCSEVAIAIGSHFFRKIAYQAFDAGPEWHTYRLEVQGNFIRLFVDGVRVLEAADNRHLSSGKVGMFSIGAQINVRSFKVI